MTQPSKTKKVYRHVHDGDVVIMNRQPSLHKPSMMCHKVRSGFRFSFFSYLSLINKISSAGSSLSK